MIIGDLILDHYVFGNVNRISPEAPVPIVEVTKEKSALGGSGNVIQNLYNLGVSLEILSSVGNDINGKKIISMLSKMMIKTDSIFSSNKTQTNYKMRIIANNQHVVRSDWDNRNLDEKIEQSICDAISSKINVIDGVIVSDYAKGVCTDKIIKEIISTARSLKKPVFIDPKGADWTKYKGSTFITPNTKEIASIINSDPNCDIDFVKAGEIIINEFEINNCLITRGADGVTFVNQEQSFHIGSEAREVYDVSGAGDTVIACLSLAILQGKSIKDSVKFANKAAGIVVSHIGTTAITLDELEF